MNDDRRSFVVGLLLAPLAPAVALVSRLWGGRKVARQGYPGLHPGGEVKADVPKFLRGMDRARCRLSASSLRVVRREYADLCRRQSTMLAGLESKHVRYPRHEGCGTDGRPEFGCEEVTREEHDRRMAEERNFCPVCHNRDCAVLWAVRMGFDDFHGWPGREFDTDHLEELRQANAEAAEAQHWRRIDAHEELT